MPEPSPPARNAKDETGKAPPVTRAPAPAPTTVPPPPATTTVPPPPAPTRAQVWRASLREFLVIVAGVLAALGAQAAWEYVQERELEETYLEQLLYDARENARRLDEAIARDSAGAVGASRLLTVLERDIPDVTADSVVSWIGSLGSASDFQPVTGTHRALLETGDLRVVRDDAVRAAVISYATALDRGAQRLEQLRGAVLAAVPAMARELPFMRLLFADGIDPANVDVAALQANDEAAAVLFAMQAATENRINGLRRMRQQTQELLAVLGDDGAAARTSPDAGRVDSVNPSSAASRRR